MIFDVVNSIKILSNSITFINYSHYLIETFLKYGLFSNYLIQILVSDYYWKCIL